MKSGEFKSAAEFSNKSADYQLATVFENPGFQNEYISRIAMTLYVKIKNQLHFTDHDFYLLEKINNIYPHLKEDDPLKELSYSIFKDCREKLEIIVSSAETESKITTSFKSILEKTNRDIYNV